LGYISNTNFNNKVLYSTVFFILFLTVIPYVTKAHESRPLYVEILETEPDIYSVKWKVPKSIPTFNTPELKVPENCAQFGTEFAGNVTDSLVRTRTFRCEGGLAGKQFAVEYPLLNPAVTTLFRLTLNSGEKRTKLLKPEESVWIVPKSEERTQVAASYTMLGVRHIIGGYDHLLFLACLILIAGTGRRILITITGFTVAHSITLVLSTLNLVKVPVPPVEAVIALSIVFLATEIAKGERGSLTYRFPVLVSVCFGLLHGFGFAAVLKEIGLPQTELATSLLFFNIGVEIGQIMFILLIIVLYKIYMWITRGKMFDIGLLEKPAAYVVGSLATFWMFSRIYSFWF